MDRIDYEKMADYERMSDAQVDAEVARAVMAWAVHCRNTAFYVDADKTTSIAADIRASKSEWQPTRKPEHSRRVLDAMVADPEKRWWPVIERMRVAHRGHDEWRVSFQSSEVFENCIGESLDRCICIAALKALESTHAA